MILILLMVKDINTILMKFKVAFQQLIDVAGKAVEMHKIKVREMKSLHDHLRDCIGKQYSAEE